jgi:hypothetical protein
LDNANGGMQTDKQFYSTPFSFGINGNGFFISVNTCGFLQGDFLSGMQYFIKTDAIWQTVINMAYLK